ncbi:MAG: Na/Pi cotransporter family protein [Bacteroidetes bacterium]|nr:MAG: Na/Pi cotransporter family protein [Bacteroidota bacterium]
MPTIASESVNYNHTQSNLQRWFLVIILIYALLVAVGIIGDGFKIATGGHAVQLFNFASNPVVALIIGIVATASIQSSSTVTSIIVGLVAGGMPLSIAIPMIMGANVGTSLTSTIVSLGHIRNGDEFKRAFSAATVHDSFNLLAVAILLPVELLFSPLERVSGFFATFFRVGATADVPGFNPIGFIVKPATEAFATFASYIPGAWSGIFMIFAGILLILFVIKSIGKVLKKVMVGRALQIMHRTIGRGPISGIGAGGIITILVQSSSTTTALIVPMAGNGIFTLRQVYPFTLGGNLGTTVTALLAAVSVTGPLAVLALQIALVHLFFNLFAIILIYSIPFLRDIPVFIAENLSSLAQRRKVYVFVYIFGVFFVGPLSIIALTRLMGM